MNGRSRLFARDEDALRALRAAVNARNVIAVERLLIQGAEIPSLDTTALYIAARLGDFEAASLLIENGVELNRRNNQGQTPLFQAAAQGNANLCELLAFRGADVNIRNFLRWHAAHVAQPNVLPILSLFGGNLDSEKVNGRTPLMAAISKGNIEAVDVLLQLNVDVNKTDKFGWTTAQVTNPDVRRLLDEFAQRTVKQLVCPHVFTKLNKWEHLFSRSRQRER
jgi:ankyrin repeat protein